MISHSSSSLTLVERAVFSLFGKRPVQRVSDYTVIGSSSVFILLGVPLLCMKGTKQCQHSCSFWDLYSCESSSRLLVLQTNPVSLSTQQAAYDDVEWVTSELTVGDGDIRRSSASMSQPIASSESAASGARLDAFCQLA